MNRKRLVSLTICCVFLIALGLCVSSLAGNKSETNPEAEQHFQKANELHILADYDAAIAEYQKVINLSPKSKIAQNAQYWIGQLYFQSKRFDAALSAFQKLVDEYPESKSIPATKQMIERVQQAKKNRALFEAAKKGDIEQVKMLISEGANINERDQDGQSVLNFAVGGGHKDIVVLLIEKGADINGRGRYDATPLHDAAWLGHKEIAELLIDKGADVNILQNYVYGTGHWTPLHSACSRGHADVAELLVANGADVTAKDEWGQTPLYYAVDNDDLDSLRILIANGAKVDTKYPGGETPLQYAAIRGKTEAVKLLLEAGADIYAKDDRGQTALHRMLDVRRNSSNSRYRQSNDAKVMVELLLAKGADVNSKDKDGRTPLHLAAELADRDIVKLLLDKGAKVNEKDDESGFTALHHAARFGNKNAAELLIARGADINAKDIQGHTPLQVAVNHDYKVAELLINKGADSSIRAESGRTLLQLAEQRKQLESTVPDMIFEGDPNSFFGDPIACGDVDGDGYEDILISAWRYNNKRGRVYLFYGGPDMNTTTDLILDGQNAGETFGGSVSCGDIDNDGYADIIIGACRYGENQGRAYLYWGRDRNSMEANPDKVFDGEARKSSFFGVRYPAVYDIDNDGYDDIILGAAGRAYLYYGSTKESMDTSYDLIFKQENPEYSFGYIINCGDIDNDGYGDIVIGPWWSSHGQAYLYYGSSRSNMDAKADLIFKAQSEGDDFFGQGIVCVDQNRDGCDDIIMSAPGYNDRQSRSYLFYGSSKKSMDANPDMAFDGEVQGSLYGAPYEVCGDIDGDKVNDIVIGAYYYRQQVGRVYVYWGNELAGPDPKPGRILTGENPYDTFGIGLACGDVNNDGFDDLVVGACGRFKPGATQGRAYLYYGGPRNK